jgi:hypothetical protein
MLENSTGQDTICRKKAKGVEIKRRRGPFLGSGGSCGRVGVLRLRCLRASRRDSCARDDPGIAASFQDDTGIAASFSLAA